MGWLLYSSVYNANRMRALKAVWYQQIHFLWFVSYRREEQFKYRNWNLFAHSIVNLSCYKSAWLQKRAAYHTTMAASPCLLFLPVLVFIWQITSGNKSSRKLIFFSQSWVFIQINSLLQLIHGCINSSDDMRKEVQTTRGVRQNGTHPFSSSRHLFYLSSSWTCGTS